MKKLTKRQIKLIAWLLTIVIVSVTLTTVFILNSRGVEDFSEEQHIARISKQIQKKYINDKTGYTDFKVYPLYNENEEVVLYMVEFEPKGFVYIQAFNDNSVFFSLLTGRTRYAISNTSFESCLYYNIGYNSQGTKEVERYLHNGQCGTQNENGWYICGISPFVLANVQNERRYVFCIDDRTYHTDYVLAVKQGDKYFNVVTNEFFTYNEGQFTPQQTVYTYIDFFYKVSKEIGWR